MIAWMKVVCAGLATLVVGLLGACRSAQIGRELERRGDEIVIAGRYFHTGAPVVLWTDPGGYDAYRVERRFVAFDHSDWASAKDKLETPNRYSLRFGKSAAASFSGEQLERVRGGGWGLDLLRDKVDQFVIHYDVCGTSRRCFQVLHDLRGLSVHFMLDIDGTIYQTLDVKERAWHATVCNDRSVGIEIANIGAYPSGSMEVLERWYEPEMTPGPAGTIGFKRKNRITLPGLMGDGGVRTPGFVGYSARDEVIFGDIQGTRYAMYDLTPQQYQSLTKLTATLCVVLPKIRCDYPRDEHGNLVLGKLDDAALAEYQGVLGHYHIQKEKIDPGPAFDWDRVINGARRLMR